MWPVVMLALNRTASVTDRTKILTVSIRTKKGARYMGAPEGVRCLKDKGRL